METEQNNEQYGKFWVLKSVNADKRNSARFLQEKITADEENQ